MKQGRREKGRGVRREKGEKDRRQKKVVTAV